MSDVIQSDAGDMLAFGATDAACYAYPGENQQAERAAFCAGAASLAASIASSADLRAKLDVALEVLAELTTTRDTLAALINPDPAQVTVAPVQHVVELLDAMIEGLATIGGNNEQA